MRLTSEVAAHVGDLPASGVSKVGRAWEHEQRLDEISDLGSGEHRHRAQEHERRQNRRRGMAEWERDW